MFSKKKEKEPSKETVTSSPEETKEKSSEDGKEKEHRFFRVATLVLSLATLGFSFYCIGSRIISGNDTGSDNSYLTLQGMSVSETKKTLSPFGKEKEGKANDYAFLGTKFFLSENHLTPSSLKSRHFFREGNYDNLSLYDITHKTTKVNSTDFSRGKCYVDFSKVGEGDYLIYPFRNEGSMASDEDYNFYSLSTENTVSETVYSLPDESGERKKITFRSNKLSPYSLFQVKKVGSILPEDTFDAVLFYRESNSGSLVSPSEESLEKLKSIAAAISEETSYKVTVASSLKEAVSVKATLSLCVSASEDGISSSLYTKTENDSYHTSLLEDSELFGYDAIPEIRESLGYLGRAGQAYDGVLGNDIHQTVSSHVGKDAYLLLDEKIAILEFLRSLQ